MDGKINLSRKSTSAFDPLPIEIISQIISYTNHQTKKNLRLVSSDLTAIIDTQANCLRFNGILTDSTAPFILNTKCPLDSVTVRNFLFPPTVTATGTLGKVTTKTKDRSNVFSCTKNDTKKSATKEYLDRTDNSNSNPVKKQVSAYDDNSNSNHIYSSNDGRACKANWNGNKSKENLYKVPTKKLIIQPQQPKRYPSGIDFILRSESLSVSEENIAALITSNRDSLESLCFAKNSLKFINPLPAMSMSMVNSEAPMIMTKLKNLEIWLTDYPTKIEQEIVIQLSTFELPALTRFSFHLRFSLIEIEHENLDFYLQTFRWISKFRNTLKILHFTYDFLLFPAFVPLVGFEDETSMRITSQEQIQQIMRFNQFHILTEQIKQIQLDELNITLSKYAGQPPYTLGCILITNQIKLTVLEVTVPDENPDHMFYIISVCIEKNLSTLRRIAVQNESGFRWRHISSRVIRSIARCNQLESLKLAGFDIRSLEDIGRKLNVKNLELSGTLNPNILLDIASLFQNLETLKFWYNVSVDPNHYAGLERNLITLLEAMKGLKLKQVKWLVGGLEMDFVLDLAGIRIQGNRNGLHECVITVVGTQSVDLDDQTN